MQSGKFILNFSPIGMIPTKAMTPYVPITPGEIVEQVLEGISLGANNIYYDRRRKTLATNSRLLKRIVDVAKMLDFEPYKTSVLRKKLGLETK